MEDTQKDAFRSLFVAYQSRRLDRRSFILQALAFGLTASTVASLLEACGGGATDSPLPQAPDDHFDGLEKELRICNWSDYIDLETIPAFEKEFGVKVTYDTFESNEELLSRLGAGDYDLVVPTAYVVTVLAAQGLLAPLDAKYLPNRVNVSALFEKPDYDPEDRYSVPWQWGTAGIAFRRDKLASNPDSWAVFLDTALKGKMTELDDMRDVIGAWLKYRGRSVNSTSADELSQAKADALAAKQNLSGYISAPVKAKLISGEVWVAQLWNGDTAQATAEDEHIAFVLPKEGSGLYTDALVIPASARHKRSAHEFMNYILRPDVGARISLYTGYGTPNAKAAEVLGAEAVPYPTDTEQKRLEYQRDLGAATELWNQVWAEIKAT